MIEIPLNQSEVYELAHQLQLAHSHFSLAHNYNQFTFIS